MPEKYSIEQYIDLINNALDDCVSTSVNTDKTGIVAEAMNYSISNAGKRIRPVLVLEFCRLCGGNINDAMNFACAIEMIHTYSLIHDDLPCMDNDDFRRGKPSCHKKFGEEYALLAGDGLLTLAFETALKCDNNVLAENKIRAVRTLANLAGVSGMVGGQELDLLFESSEPTLEKLQQVDKLKTGALIKASALLGCYASNTVNVNHFDSAKKYSECIGHAFQIVDDILDVTSDSKTLGKPVGSDEKNEKITYVSLMGIEKSKQTVNSLTDEAISALSVFDGDISFLETLAKNLANRNK